MGEISHTLQSQPNGVQGTTPFTGKPVRFRARTQSLRLGWGKAGAEKVGGTPRKRLPWEQTGHEHTSKSSLSHFKDLSGL